jgi:hypothetical protein
LILREMGGDAVSQSLGSNRAGRMMCDEPPASRRYSLDLDEAVERSGRSFRLGAAPAKPAKSAQRNGLELPAVNLARLVGRIDWETDPRALRRGDLSSLSPELIAAIQAASQLPAIVAFAKTTGIERVVVVIGLLARAAAGKNRAAQRVARAIFSGSPASGVEAAMSEVGL